MAALEIAHAVKDLIETSVMGLTPMIQDVGAGNTGVWVQNANEYIKGERVVLRSNTKVEFHTIQCPRIVDGDHALFFCEPITADFSRDDTFVQKLHNGQLIQEITIGNPDHIDNFPAITIEARSMIREPLTLSSVSDQYSIEVACWMDATNYNDAYASCLVLTDNVAQAIYKDMYPLTEPFVRTTLTSDLEPTDTVLQVLDETGLVPGSWVWLVNQDKTKRHNRIVSRAENAITLAFPVAASFAVGDTITRPLTRLYDPRIESISYDDASDGDLLLKSSTITYTIKLHRPRVK